MPKKPRKTKGGVKLSGPSQMHLLEGCCLMGCQVCAGARAIAGLRMLDAWTLEPTARATWERNRESLLEIWRDPAGHQPGTSNFSAEHSRGTGRYFPCFAEVIFDSAPWPKLNRSWPKAAKRFWENIDDALRAGGTTPR
jgi:hypothetical protein